ncbi:MAG TPA: Hsp70 family protein [Oscillatoriales cyanobacterium M59_W2019_021]|nr:MAG: Hsp70 family protein [Cyanobacteria bacterium J055]HIK33491.1 Hsp70 family protein [Oscillatoriales cyanobacterium M4454_W2019_049]HIK50231.1 Hsp70 family protein [Oscillatoriales cyanobacterium M59_W2019_021]
MAIAIDFGTSNTVVARWNPITGQPETLKLPGLSVQQGQNPPLIPSLVYVEDAAKEQILAGKTVLDRGLDLSKDPRFFRNFKRGIGSEIQGFLPELDGKTVTFEQAGQWFLTEIARSIRDVPLSLDSLILTVPVDSFEIYRHWLGKVCQDLEIDRVRMVDEPTAAALGYGLADREIVLVVDFGGGTLDLSVVRLEAGGKTPTQPLGFILKWGEKSFAESSGQKVQTARVLAKAGQNLGGSDIDNWLVDYFVQTQGLAKSPIATRLAERLKIQLSLQTQASEVYFNDETFESYELELDRDRFETILTDRLFFKQLDESMTQVLQQARRQGIEIGDIDAVLLVGGTSQIPAVQTWVQQYFAAEKIRAGRPLDAIATGALQLTQGIEVKDFLYHSYGIRYWDRRQNAHNWHPIIKAGQPYPMTEPVELLLGASMANQPKIELVLGELGNDSAATEVYFDGDRLVTRPVAGTQATVKPLNDTEGGRSIAQLNPLGNPGTDRIKVRFRIDDRRFLRISVEDLLTMETLLDDRAVIQLS